MSIFKAREWWSVPAEEGGDGDGRGFGSVTAARLGTQAPADSLVVGEAATLRVYSPDGEYRPQHLLIEAQLEHHILQVGAGKFIAVSDEIQVIVLHPMKMSVFMLQSKEGHTDVGDQNMLIPVITHTLNKKAYNFVHGNFGYTKSRELVCVQSLDGTFTFFDQEVALFSCSLLNIVIPGPFGYIKSCDSFVIHKSNWVMEIYSYQQMMDLGNPEQRTKRLLPQWVYNPGEEIYSMQVIQTSNNFSSIIALGERHLYCLQDNGLLKFMKRFDFIPVCFHAYLIGWYYEPNCRLLIMLASEDSKLLVYESTTLLWSCELPFTPIAISRCFLKGLPGGIVSLSEDGALGCYYLGTEPDLSGAAPPAQAHDHIDPESVQTQLAEVEATLKELTEKEENEDDTPIESFLTMSVVVKEFSGEVPAGRQDRVSSNPVCPVAVNMNFKDPASIQNVQVTFFCTPPFVSSETVRYLDIVSAFEVVETEIFVSSEIEISQFYVKVLVTFTDDVGKIRTVSDGAALPLMIFFVPTQMPSEFKHSIKIKSNKSDGDLYKLFPEYAENEWLKNGATRNMVTFSNRSTNSIVSINMTGQSYCIQADHYSHMAAVTEYLITKLKTIQGDDAADHRAAVSWEGKFDTEILHSFMKCIESHASVRLQWKQNEDELEILQSQFTLIQRKLLAQYGALPPGDCDCLEFLLKDTYQRISKTVKLIIDCRQTAYRAGGALISVGRLIVMVLRLIDEDTAKTDLLEEILSLNSLYEYHQDWEETVSQAISHVLSTKFGKSEKDKERLAPVSEDILNPANVKRFMKQIKILLERMFGDLKDHKGANGQRKKSTNPERVEELVEVL